MGMPPCKWSATAFNPMGGSGLCVGQPDVCEPMTKEQCDAVDRASPAAGGWSRYVLPMAKYGPVIATDVDPMALSIRTVLNGDERQNYPVADMIFPPHRLVSLLSHDMTLLPGDVIACGTSIGVGSMKQPTNEVTIAIEGIGELTNTYVNE